MSPRRVRVFYALWPDRDATCALTEAAQHLHRVVRGRPPRNDSIHLTLAFVGDVDDAALAKLLAPPGLTVPRFSLTLDRWGCWPRNGIAWMAPTRVPDSLSRLVGGMEAWLRDSGFEIDTRPFAPHVTLVRKAKCVPLPDPAPRLEWRVDEFVLVRSTLAPDGSRYEIIGRWPLLNPDG